VDRASEAVRPLLVNFNLACSRPLQKEGRSSLYHHQRSCFPSGVSFPLQPADDSKSESDSDFDADSGTDFGAISLQCLLCLRLPSSPTYQALTQLIPLSSHTLPHLALSVPQICLWRGQGKSPRSHRHLDPSSANWWSCSQCCSVIFAPCWRQHPCPASSRLCL
jgi:hypothetical protein